MIRIPAAAILLAGVLSASACGGGSGAAPPSDAGTTPPPPQGSVITVGLARSVPLLDPAFIGSTLGRSVAAAVCTPLVTYLDAPGAEGRTLVPGLARDLPRVSSDDRSFRVTLKSGLRFSDGKPLGAHDVQATFERLLSPATHSPDAGLFADLAGAAAYRSGRTGHLRGVRVQGHDVLFHLRAGDPSFVARLATAAACPVARGAPDAPDGHIWQGSATGPFRVAAVRPGRAVRLVPNPAYDPSLLGARGGGAGFNVRGALGVAGARRCLRSRACDLILGVPPGRVGRLAGTHASGIASGELTVLRFEARTPLSPLAESTVRRALNLAIDRVAVATAMGGPLVAVPASGLMTPAMPGYRATDPYPLRANQALAHRLLVSSGVSLPFRATLVAAPADRPAARVIVRDLRRVGIEVRVAAPPAHEPVDMVLSHFTPAYGDARAVLVGLLGPAGLTGGGPTGAGFDVAGLSDRVRVALGRGGEARAAAFAELSLSLVRDDAPVAVLWRANFPVLSTSRIGGMFAQPLYGLDLAALRRAG
jgi:peptide/nickel transport system substrate-binding protein